MIHTDLYQICDEYFWLIINRFGVRKPGDWNLHKLIGWKQHAFNILIDKDRALDSCALNSTVDK